MRVNMRGDMLPINCPAEYRQTGFTVLDRLGEGCTLLVHSQIWFRTKHTQVQIVELETVKAGFINTVSCENTCCFECCGRSYHVIF